MQHVPQRRKHGGRQARGQCSDPGEGLSKESLLQAYRNMLTARFIDSRILTLLKQGKVFFHIGGSGHETAQTAVALALKPGYDWAYPYYRDLAFSLQFGYSVEEIMLEALHREGGPSSAASPCPSTTATNNGGSWHSPARPEPSSFQAVGTAMGAVKEGKEEVVYVSSGEGATSEGEFHEAVNWAAREQIPGHLPDPEQQVRDLRPGGGPGGREIRLCDGSGIRRLQPLPGGRMRLRSGLRCGRRGRWRGTARRRTEPDRGRRGAPSAAFLVRRPEKIPGSRESWRKTSGAIRSRAWNDV